MSFRLETGTFESTLDEKGRVVIPASMRDRYKGELVITQSWESCVWIMTSKTYEEFMKTLEKSVSSLSYEEYTALKYQTEAPAQVTEIDPKSGRVPIPAAIRSYARLSRDCLVLSIDGHLKIWDAQVYRERIHEMQVTAREAMKKLGPVHFFPKGVD